MKSKIPLKTLPAHLTASLQRYYSMMACVAFPDIFIHLYASLCPFKQKLQHTI